MKKYLQHFKEFLREAEDPSYYQETFYFTVLISMNKNLGGSRDETKNDIRALPEILTVTLVEPQKGGIQRDIGTKYLSTLKIHVRKPRNISKKGLMRRVVLHINNLRGVSVLRYKERKPKQRKKAFHGTYSITELDYQKVRRQKAGEYAKDKAEYASTGPQKKGGAPYSNPYPKKRGKSAPPIVGATGGAFGLEETQLDEAMKTTDDIPEDVVVVVLKESDSSGFQVYYAHRDKPNVRLKAGDLDRMEAGTDIFGTLHVGRGRNEPYENVYVITSAKAKDGFGPLLYDVALEVAGEHGLKPDVEDVSDEANAVWKHYDTQREDVRATMLVADPDEYSLVMPYRRAEHPEANQHLAKAYFKEGTVTIDSLISQDKYINFNESGPLYEGCVARLLEDILITIGASNDDLMAFDVQEELNPKLWDTEDLLYPGVSAAIMDVVDEFMESLDLDIEVEDIIITGSIANYNWSKFSDIDVHILVDFATVDENRELVKRFFDAVRSNWNKLHNIYVKGHEVEIYLQDVNEPHISTGVYSLSERKWRVRPKKIKPYIDKHTATKKMKYIAREIDKLEGLYERGQHQEAYSKALALKEKIKRMRQAGLQKSGIYSPENLAFKMLRRSGDIEMLFNVFTKAYDKIHSVDQ